MDERLNDEDLRRKTEALLADATSIMSKLTTQTERLATAIESFEREYLNGRSI